MMKAYCIIFFLTFPLVVDAQVRFANYPLISAHRGASRMAPENTIAAFSKAIDAGANYIEIDVRTTSDGHQVVVHDKSLQRTTGMNSLVKETDLATIKSLSAGKWFGSSFEGEKVPTLEEVCKLVKSENQEKGHNIKLYVDCKDIDPAKVIGLLIQYSLMDSAVFYGDIETLSSIKQHFNPARLMPSFSSVGDAENVMKLLSPYAFDVPFEKLDESTVAFIHGRQIKVFSDLLGENDLPEAYRKALKLDIDLIQTDDVDAVLSTYQEFKTVNK